jgi:hypothetical protein
MKRQLVPLLCQNLQLAGGFTFLQNANLTIEYMYRYMPSINLGKTGLVYSCGWHAIFFFAQKT